MEIQIERRVGERRSRIDRRQVIDPRYEDPEFCGLIDRRSGRDRRIVDQRKNWEANQR